MAVKLRRQLSVPRINLFGGLLSLSTFFLVVLCIENCASMLARRYAVGVLHLAFSKSSVLCVNELLKLLSTPMFVPAVVYLVVNLISYPALERINASVFTAISQLKVLATALFAVLMLKTEVSERKWRTLSMMVLGVTLVSLENAPDAHVSHSHTNLHEWGELISVDYVVGIALATVQTLLSGFGAIYFEKVLKSRARADGGEAFTVWDRNIQLAIYSICIYLPCACYETQGNVLVGWTPLVWLIASLHAAGGILVALSVLYSNSITKTVAVCGSLVFTTVLGKVFFDAPLNGPILLGCAVVILSIFGYRDDCNLELQIRELAKVSAAHARTPPGDL